jgi:peptide/nickel transport system ATP-binding protein
MPTLGHWEDRFSHVAACHMTTEDSGHSLAGTA